MGFYITKQFANGSAKMKILIFMSLGLLKIAKTTLLQEQFYYRFT